MSEFMFGVGNGRVSKSVCAKIDRIAKKHGATFVNPKMPEGWRYWFAGPNRGQPFDDAMARAVYADLDAAGITLPK